MTRSITTPLALALALVGCTVQDDRTPKNGVDGLPGTQGLVGPQGLKGDTGATGASGVDGLPGTQGPIGPQGLKGDTGPVGATGPIGPQGLKGDTGTTGKEAASYTDAMAATACNAALKGDLDAMRTRLAVLEAKASAYCTANSQCLSGNCVIAATATAGICTGAVTPPPTMSTLGVTAVGLTADKVTCWDATPAPNTKSAAALAAANGQIFCPVGYDASLVIPITVTGGICTGEGGQARATPVHLLNVGGVTATWQGCQR